MRILVLGGNGLIGSGIMFNLDRVDNDWEVWTSASNRSSTERTCKRFSKAKVLTVDLGSASEIKELLHKVSPNVVINAAGVTKHSSSYGDTGQVIRLNAVLPFHLANMSKTLGFKLIHVSTDCVFDGLSGRYTEDDIPSASDIYGLTKILGEKSIGGRGLILRTSTVGLDQTKRDGLLEWFLHQNDVCEGYTGAFFSGMSTLEFGRVISEFVLQRPDLLGIYHVAGPRISKFELLHIFKSYFCKDITVKASRAVIIDRSLDASRFQKDVGYMPPSWSKMIQSLRETMDEFNV